MVENLLRLSPWSLGGQIASLSLHLGLSHICPCHHKQMLEYDVLDARPLWRLDSHMECQRFFHLYKDKSLLLAINSLHVQNSSFSFHILNVKNSVSHVLDLKLNYMSHGPQQGLEGPFFVETFKSQFKNHLYLLLWRYVFTIVTKSLGITLLG